MRRVFAYLALLERQVKVNRRWVMAAFYASVIAGVLGVVADIVDIWPEAEYDIDDVVKDDFDPQIQLYQYQYGKPTLIFLLNPSKAAHELYGSEYTFLLSHDGNKYHGTTYLHELKGPGFLDGETLYLKIESRDGGKAGPFEYEFKYRAKLREYFKKLAGESYVLMCQAGSCRLDPRLTEALGFISAVEYSEAADFADPKVIEIPDVDDKFVLNRDYLESIAPRHVEIDEPTDTLLARVVFDDGKASDPRELYVVSGRR